MHSGLHRRRFLTRGLFSRRHAIVDAVTGALDGFVAQLPELVGFFSYSREDDEAFRDRFGLRDAIQRELGAQLGRTKRNIRLWQDQEAIAPGKDWEAEITGRSGSRYSSSPS